MIRQAISCDVCGTEKQLTNHWFVAYDLGGELRVSGWNSRNRQRAEARHLCGQTCLHKLVDEFMAKALRVSPPKRAEEKSIGKPPEVRRKNSADPNVTAGPVTPAVERARIEQYPDEFESSARLLTSREAALAMRAAQQKLTAMPKEISADPEFAIEPSIISQRNWRAEAWKREREREQRATEQQTSRSSRRRSIA